MSLTYSPSNQLLIQELPDGTHEVIGNAVNIIIETTRGKIPIFTFGSALPRANARGQRFISGSIDMVIFNETFLNQFSMQNKRYITEVESNLVESEVLSEQKIYGTPVNAYYTIDSNLDDIEFSKLILISQNPQPKEIDGKAKLEYLEIVLYDVQFYDYSYAKQINDVAQLERVSFMARSIAPTTTKYKDVNE